MSDIKVAAFDCDGVLFDTRQANTAYYNEVLGHFGKPPMTEEQFAYTHMHTVDRSMAFLFPDPDELGAAQAFRRQMEYRKFVRYMEIDPHLTSVIPKIRPPIRTAIATNRSDSMGYVLVEHGIESLFDYVVTALDVTHAKPHPEPLLKILRHFRIHPQEMIYVGDSELDQASAQSAEVPFVAYGNPELTARFHIRTLQDLEEILLHRALAG